MCDHPHQNRLMPTAAALAESLASGFPIADEGIAESIREVLFSESADASDEAAERCALIRTALAREVCETLRLDARTVHLLGEDGGDVDLSTWVPPPVRVEIRGTAGRLVSHGVFAIGSSPNCEVHLLGDASVLPLQCLVISLPGGIVTVDLWSDNGTCMNFHQRHGHAGETTSTVTHKNCLLIAHGDRATFQVGQRTTVSFGPSAKKMQKKERKAAKHEKKHHKSKSHHDHSHNLSVELQPIEERACKLTPAEIRALDLEAQEEAMFGHTTKRRCVETGSSHGSHASTTFDVSGSLEGYTRTRSSSHDNEMHANQEISDVALVH